MNLFLQPRPTPLIIAHRANGGGFPENSLAGIQHAIETGIEMVEIDVRLTRDVWIFIKTFLL